MADNNDRIMNKARYDCRVIRIIDINAPLCRKKGKVALSGNNEKQGKSFTFVYRSWNI